nr:TonB-dependent receptor [Saprospiraceae bacterium]
EKFNFDVNYTYNHSTSAFSDINNNTPYNTNFFRPHSFNMAIGWRPFKKITFNLKSIFSSGHPISIPVNAYIYNNVVGLIFNEKNNGRYPDYFRMDVSIEFLKSKKSIWNFSVYNLTNKRNPFAITFEDKVQYTTYEDVVNFKIIPSISYTYKFYGYN